VSGEILAIALRWQRRILIALAVLVLGALLGVVYALGAKDDACEPPPLDEVSEAYRLDHPECVDGGAP
jgi:hypothetical protein